ncbi:NAD(P)H-dependent oxidoreductase [Maribacter polysiphoniae]|uniref:NAD(P)H-dependent FMN reductase n=1 Tax=Maribacter polysiphoniae TaxID=429344 RepID=A0A316DUV7_9FLAO|nr:NAD(P)H-dependent oxidoreductase [Maribacter polysiphoniae]MBD1262045.1 NAD(P)H-dependent oxidoreductase [Maribacter polysiphoniae]PWK21735.1 NAD(P)H-dependent FMN reductase [Maribacter polysiphoniae]
MSSILAFAGSNSASSINFKLVRYTSSLIHGHEVELVNMASETFPMYSEDREKQLGFPEALVKFQKKIETSDAILVSVNEHNGGPSAYFKNLLDWMSRSNRNYLENTKIFLMSTSPGQRAAIGAHEFIKNTLPRVGGEVSATFSLPSFNTNFEETQGIVDQELRLAHKIALDSFLQQL